MVEIVLILAFVIIFFAVMGRDFFQSFPVTAKYNWGFTIFIAALWIVRVTAFFYCAVPVMLVCCGQLIKTPDMDALIAQFVKVPFAKWIFILAGSYILEYLLRFIVFIFRLHLYRNLQLVRKINEIKGSKYRLCSFSRDTLSDLDAAVCFFEQGQISREQFSVFADPEYTAEQLSQIISGYRCGLSDNQVALYTDKRYNVHQMEEIRFGLARGLSIDEIKQYASPETDSHYMFVIRNELLKQKICISDPKEILTQKKEENKSAGAASKEGD